MLSSRLHFYDMVQNCIVEEDLYRRWYGIIWKRSQWILLLNTTTINSNSKRFSCAFSRHRPWYWFCLNNYLFLNINQKVTSNQKKSSQTGMSIKFLCPFGFDILRDKQHQRITERGWGEVECVNIPYRLQLALCHWSLYKQRWQDERHFWPSHSPLAACIET